MKNILSVLIFGVFLVISSCNVTDKEAELQVEKLIENKDFFQLRSLIEKSELKISRKNRLLANAFLENSFNKNGKSNRVIEELMTKYQNELPDTLITELLWLKADNYLKLFQYKKAYEANNIILEKFQNIIDSTERAETETMSKIYKPLSEIAPQTIEMEGDQIIPITRDIVGLMNVDVSIHDSTYSFIFDTGAGMSVITRGFAQKLGLSIYDTEFDVKAATGNVIKSSLAVMDSFYLGDIKISNAVFLVMEDSLMQFPQINFYPLGIVGFPIIEELNEISITKTDTLFIPKVAQKSDLRNLCLSSLSPHVYLYNGIDTLEYAFDTGAKSSHFTQKYYKKYTDELEHYAKIDTIKNASAGGVKELTAIFRDSILLFIGEKPAVLRNIHIHNEYNDAFDDVYGNLGQDLIAQFDKMTLNFESMFLKFE